MRTNLFRVHSVSWPTRPRRRVIRRTTLEGNHGVSKSEFTRRLGEAGYGRESGRVGVLNLLARAGLPVPEGTVLTHRAHEEFLRDQRHPEGHTGAAGEPAARPRRFGESTPRARWRES